MRKAAEGLGQAHAAAALADEVERAAQAKASSIEEFGRLEGETRHG